MRGVASLGAATPTTATALNILCKKVTGNSKCYLLKELYSTERVLTFMPIKILLTYVHIHYICRNAVYALRRLSLCRLQFFRSLSFCRKRHSIEHSCFCCCCCCCRSRRLLVAGRPGCAFGVRRSSPSAAEQIHLCICIFKCLFVCLYVSRFVDFSHCIFFSRIILVFISLFAFKWKLINLQLY